MTKHFAHTIFSKMFNVYVHPKISESGLKDAPP